MARAGTAYVDFEGDFGPLNRQLAARLRAIRPVDIKFQADDSDVNRTLAGISAKARAIHPEVKVDVDTSAFSKLSADSRKAGRDVDLATKSVTGLADAALGSAGAISALALGMADGAGAAVALTAALGPVVGLLGALPGGLLGLGQIVTAVGVGFNGVADAVKAGNDALAKNSSQARTAANAQKSAANQVSAAQEGVRNATNGVTKAQERLADAQVNAIAVQGRLDEAREAARRHLEDMRLAAERAANSQRGASLSLTEAEKQLSEARADPSKSRLEIKQLENDVDNARTALKDANTDKKRTDEDNRKAQKAGVNQSDEVKKAKQDIADANKQVRDSQEQLTEAQHDAARAQTAVADAQTAAVAASAGNTAATDKYRDALAKLTPEQRKFVKLLISMKPQFDSLQDAIGKEMFPGLTSGLKDAMKNFDTFKDGVADTGGVIGDLAAQAGKLIGSKGFGADIKSIMDSNNRTMKSVGDGAIHFADGLTQVAVAAEPLVEWLGKVTDAAGKDFDKWAKGARDSGKLADFFQETEDTLTSLWHIFRDVGAGLLNIFSDAKPLGDETLTSIEGIAKQFREWTESAKGKNDIKQFFEDIKDPLKSAVDLVGSLGSLLGELTKHQGGLKVVLDSVAGVFKILDGLIENVPVLGDLLTAAFGIAVLRRMPVLLGMRNILTTDKLGPWTGKLIKWATDPAFNWIKGLFGGKSPTVTVRQPPVSAQAVGTVNIEAAVVNILGVAGAGGIGLPGGKGGLKPGETKTPGGIVLPRGVGGAGEAVEGAAKGAGALSKITPFLAGASKLVAPLAAFSLAINLIDSKGNPINAVVNTAHDLTFGLVPKLKTEDEKDQAAGNKIATQLPPSAQELLTPEQRKELGDLQRKMDAGNARADRLSNPRAVGAGKGTRTIGADEEGADKERSKVAEEGRRYGELYAKSYVEGVNSQYQFFDSKELTKGFEDQLQKLPASARKSAESTMIEFARQMESDGRLPKGASSTIVRNILKDFDLLPEGISKPARKGQDSLAEQFRRRDVIDAADRQTTDLKIKYGFIPQELKTDGKHASDNFAAEIDALRDKLKDKNVTGDMRKNIAHDLHGVQLDAQKYSAGAGSVLDVELKKMGVKGSDDAYNLRTKLVHHFNQMASGIGAASTTASVSVYDALDSMGANANEILTTLGLKPPKVRLTKPGSKGAISNDQSSPLIDSSQLQNPLNRNGLQRGGMLPGSRTGDRVPAMLEDGEYVVNRNAVGKMGKEFFDRINFGHAPRFQTGGLAQFNHVYPKHFLGQPGVRFTADEVLAIAQSRGLPGRPFEQIAHGESDYHPGIIGDDAAAGYGNTFGYGLWQITTGVGHDALVESLGGWDQMLNPLKNAQAAKSIYDAAGGFSPWYGTKYLNVAGSADNSGGGGGVAQQIGIPGIKGKGVLADTAAGVINEVGKQINKKLATASPVSQPTAGAVAAPGTPPIGAGSKGPVGVDTFMGLPMAKWVIEALQYAQSKGVDVHPTSGYRPGIDPHTASGKSEHQGTQYPHGAVDFGGYDTGLAMKMAVVNATKDFKYPLLAPIGFHDDGHASGTGHQRGGLIQMFQKGGSPAIPDPSAVKNLLTKIRKSIDKGKIGGAGTKARNALLAKLSKADVPQVWIDAFGKANANITRYDALATQASTATDFKSITKMLGDYQGKIGRKMSDAEQDKFITDHLVSVSGMAADGSTKSLNQIGWLGEKASAIAGLRNRLIQIAGFIKDRIDQFTATIRELNERRQKLLSQIEDATDQINGKGKYKGQALKGDKRKDIVNKRTKWQTEYNSIAGKDGLTKKFTDQRDTFLDFMNTGDGGVLPNLLQIEGYAPGLMSSYQPSMYKDKLGGTAFQRIDPPLLSTWPLPASYPFGTFGGDLQTVQTALRDAYDVSGYRTDPTDSDTNEAKIERLKQLLLTADLNAIVSDRALSVFQGLGFGGSFDKGGVVPGELGAPTLILAHGGEVVTPVDQAQSAGSATAVLPTPELHLHMEGKHSWLQDVIDTRVEQKTRSNATHASRRLPGRAGRIV